MLTIVDYQMGNLRSVQKAFEQAGHAAWISSDPAQVAEASKIVLPGVGAFADAAAELKRRGLVEPILAGIEQGKPFLGICLGLQLLFDHSFEDGQHEGLGVVPGEVVRFDVPREHKVPHMGWNQLRIHQQAPILEGIDEGAYFYFVHSYYVVPERAEVVATETDYPEPFCSMIWRDNVYATQFHPEKSQANGLRVLKNFGDLSS